MHQYLSFEWYLVVPGEKLAVKIQESKLTGVTSGINYGIITDKSVGSGGSTRVFLVKNSFEYEYVRHIALTYFLRI